MKGELHLILGICFVCIGMFHMWMYADTKVHVERMKNIDAEIMLRKENLENIRRVTNVGNK